MIGLSGCVVDNSTLQIAAPTKADSIRYHLERPPAYLFNCPRPVKLPKIKTASELSIAKALYTSYTNNKKCYLS
jgi:hypothetical protein